MLLFLWLLVLNCSSGVCPRFVLVGSNSLLSLCVALVVLRVLLLLALVTRLVLFCRMLLFVGVLWLFKVVVACIRCVLCCCLLYYLIVRCCYWLLFVGVGGGGCLLCDNVQAEVLL